MNSFRVITVIPSAEFAGTELSVLKSAIFLKEAGIQIQIWTLSDSQIFDQICTENGIPLKKFPIHWTKPFKSLFHLLRITRNAIRLKNSYVFHFFLPKSYLLGYFLKKTIKLKYILGVRGKINYRGRFVEFLVKQAMQDAHYVVCNAEHLISEINIRFNLHSENVIRISNLVTQRSMQQNSQVEKYKNVTAVVVSNFIEYKGHLFLLETLAKMSSPPHVILIGQGPMESAIRESIDILRLSQSVEIIHLVDLERVLSKSHFAIHPSETEGLSNAILEEISFGLPVIAFDVGGNREIITDEFNGFLLKDREVSRFSNAIETLTNNVEIRSQLGLNAFEVSKLFSPETYFQKISNVYGDTFKVIHKPKFRIKRDSA